MAERSSLNQVIQVGVETVPGTAVAATRRFQALGIEPSPNMEIDQFRPMGQKYRSIATLSKEWVTASLSGRGSYTELVYVLSSVIDTATITTPIGATSSRLWTFTPDSFGDDNPRTYTVEHGSAFRADRFAYGLVTEVGMSFSRDSVELSGSMMGTALEDNITLTPSGVTSVPLVPILSSDLSVFMDNTAAALGTTQLGRVISAEFSLGSRFSPVWVMDATENSYVAVIESEPDLTMSLMMEADSEGMAQLATVRNGGTRFIRIRAVDSSTIEVGHNYEFTLDFAGKVSDTGGFSDSDGIYAIEWSFVGVHDPAWNKAYEIRIKNNLTAL